MDLEKPIWLQLRHLGEGSITAHMAWKNIDDYSMMALIQLHRIAESNAFDVFPEQLKQVAATKLGVTPDEYDRVSELHATMATVDAHFYLNCWRIVALNAFRIARVVNDARLNRFIVDQQCSTLNRRGDGLVFDKTSPSYTFGWYAQGRDHFEHIDERILGGRNWDKVKIEPSKVSIRPGFEDLYRPDADHYPQPVFSGSHMNVGNSRWEITIAAHNKLMDAVGRLYQIGADLLDEQTVPNES